VVYVMQQDRILGAAGEGVYQVERGWAGRPEYGNAALVRAPLTTTDPERLDLRMRRSALGLTVPLAEGPLRFAVTHLHHVVGDAALRDEQAAALVAWLGASPVATQVVVGDFNATPGEPTYARMVAAGYRSAYREANGDEPTVTWPSGLQAPAMDTDGRPGCLDYIWLRGAVAAESAMLAWHRPAVDDPTLYPSDHVGVAAVLRVG
jgi:endonuclease/exonuclease/phosphatase family metal-dependent hydrolase